MSDATILVVFVGCTAMVVVAIAVVGIGVVRQYKALYSLIDKRFDKPDNKANDKGDEEGGNTK